ncbi:MAG: hypothetical protein ABJA82_00735 [Myxococcales bacterium]
MTTDLFVSVSQFNEAAPATVTLKHLRRSSFRGRTDIQGVTGNFANTGARRKTAPKGGLPKCGQRAFTSGDRGGAGIGGHFLSGVTVRTVPRSFPDISAAIWCDVSNTILVDVGRRIPPGAWTPAAG